MKTTKNIIRLIDAKNCHLVLNTRTNELFEVKHKNTIITYSGDSIVHTFMHGEKDILVLQGCPEFKLYASIEDFERSNPMTTTEFTLSAHLKCGEHMRVNPSADGSELELVSVKFVNGIPVEVESPLCNFCVDTNNRVTPVYPDDVNIAEYFCSVEAAVAFIPYEVRKEDGTKRVIEGKYQYLMPTKEQQKAIDAVRKAMQAAKDAGVGMFFDVCDEHVYAFNGLNAEINYDNGGFQFNVELPECLHLPSISYYNNDDCYGIVKKGALS